MWSHVHHPVLDQLHLAGHVHRDRGIQALGDLLVVQLRTDSLDKEKPAPDQGHDQEQGGRQLREQRIHAALAVAGVSSL